MKIKIFLLFCFIFVLTLFGFSQNNVTLEAKNIPLKDIIRAIENQSNVTFFYNDNYLDLSKKVTLKVENKSLNDVLLILKESASVDFAFMPNNLVIIRPLNTKKQFRVTGKVIDNAVQPIVGAIVTVKGSSRAVLTDALGDYSILVSPNDRTLVFSFIGMKKKEVAISNQKNIDVYLETMISQLKEVVVTALGIKQDKKALSYSSQQISSLDLSKGTDLNFASGFSGKIAGLELRKSTSGAGGSTKITLRGEKSLYGTNQPLFVIDGIPMENSQFSSPIDFWGGRDSGDGLSSLNPDDIESMTVLKGANAATLYGSQGANGVIVITTKKGKKGKTTVSLTSSLTFEKATDLPKLQYTYGQTAIGSLDSWGAKGNYNNNAKDFFSTGVNSLNAVSISGGNDITTAYLSYSNSSSNGILPTNQFVKNNITVKQSTKLFGDRMTVSSNVMLVDQQIDNKVLNGYYWNPLTGLYLFPRGLDFGKYKSEYQVFDPNRNLMTQNWPVSIDIQQNPYWILNNNSNTESTKRVIGHLELTYQLTKDILIQARGNYDYTQQIFEQKIKAGTNPVLAPPNGRWAYDNYYNSQKYADLIIFYNSDFGKDFVLHSILGTSYERKINGDGLIVDSNQDGLTIPNEFYFQNLKTAPDLRSVINGRSIKESVFSNLSLGFKEMLYIDLSVRNDWASTLAFTKNQAYFYPSAGFSFLFDKLVKLPKIIDYAKLRASYSQVGNEVPAFFTNPLNTVSRDGLILNTEKPFTELKPESQYSLEMGFETRLFNNRLALDATWYKIDNKNQFLPLDAPAGSGYTRYYVNAGHIQNKGFELTLIASPIKTSSFNWKTEANYSQNKNKVIELDPSLTGRFNLGGGGDGFDMFIEKGGSIGDIYVNAFKRDAKGNLLLTDDGVPIKDIVSKKIGNANPKLMLGWNNTFSYKNFTFSFLIDSKIGGKCVSMSEAFYDQYGVSQRTADARDQGGVKVVGVKSDGSLFSGIVSAQKYYTGIAGRDGILESYVYDATTIRFRQMSLTYSLDLKNKHLFDNMSFSIIAQNLFFIYKKAPFDPDLTIGTGNGIQSVESFCLPPTKSIGFSMKINF
jgi:TonB-linked SusC/RagA family outer membrane protein